MAKVNESANCLIGEGSVFEGRFFVDGSIRIEGKFQGEIKTGDQLFIAPSGKVKTDIVAKRVVVAGTLIGNITASEEVNLIETGKVLGNITTPKLVVEPGVVTEGKVTITATISEDVESVIKSSFGEETNDLFTGIEKTGMPKQKSEKNPPK
jgi:cytoskeletal protein CcmA (bactofilin family)